MLEAEREHIREAVKFTSQAIVEALTYRYDEAARCLDKAKDRIHNAHIAGSPEPDTLVIQLSYFRKSGKWYTDVEYLYPYGYVPYFAAVDHIIHLQGIGALPGLKSGKWSGPILINSFSHPHGHPVLIGLPG